MEIDPIVKKKLFSQLKVLEDEKSKDLLLERSFMRNLNKTINQVNKLKSDEKVFKYFNQSTHNVKEKFNDMAEGMFNLLRGYLHGGHELNHTEVSSKEKRKSKKVPINITLGMNITANNSMNKTGNESQIMNNKKLKDYNTKLLNKSENITSKNENMNNTEIKNKKQNLLKVIIT